MDKNNTVDWVARGLIILTCIYGVIFALIYFFTIGELSLFPIDCKIGEIILCMMGLIFIGLAILVAAKPDDPLPWSWFTTIILGGVLVGIEISIVGFRIPGVTLILSSILMVVYSNSKNKEV